MGTVGDFVYRDDARILPNDHLVVFPVVVVCSFAEVLGQEHPEELHPGFRPVSDHVYRLSDQRPDVLRKTGHQVACADLAEFLHRLVERR
ncbi:hypothetical protein [Streptomyces lydicus]|uniref:hypothetical protein n=1 Tax=Streptomyces lydicus TaxID=47763 RepID=UPI00378D27D2